MGKTAKKPAGRTGDLFSSRAVRRPAMRVKGKGPRGGDSSYSARHIEVLEGLEPVRRRPGMYIGGTDEKALHHLFAEVIDNSMDEALEGHASFIEVEMHADGFVSVTANGRGIPVDPHPKFKNKSVLDGEGRLEGGGRWPVGASIPCGGAWKYAPPTRSQGCHPCPSESLPEPRRKYRFAGGIAVGGRVDRR